MLSKFAEPCDGYSADGASLRSGATVFYSCSGDTPRSSLLVDDYTSARSYIYFDRDEG